MRKTLEEIETMVIRNGADWREGFFTVYTSDPKAFEKLKSRIGEENFISCHCTMQKGDIWDWKIKLPRYLYSRTTLGVKKAIK